MLVKRRLGILKSLIDELGLQVTVRLVKSEANKADALTRIRKRWLMSGPDVGCVGVDQVEEMHKEHHMGVERTWYLAKKIDGGVGKDVVKSVVRRCQECQSIDPAPVTHTAGELGVGQTWSRLAIDVTHYRGLPYLTMVDCGPGRFLIWREMRGETAVEICKVLDTLFYERGPVKELLMDNAQAFRSKEMEGLLEKWGVCPLYHAALRASGNGIVERSHRTIKAMAERTGKSPVDAVFWYNVAPRYGQKPESIPQRSVAAYEWRLPREQGDIHQERDDASVHVGDQVWVKPGNARCTTRWMRGGVTRVNSANNIDVDGVPRHVLDIRRVVEDSSDEAESDEEPAQEEQRYPRRERRAPVWLQDFVQE